VKYETGDVGAILNVTTSMTLRCDDARRESLASYHAAESSVEYAPFGFLVSTWEMGVAEWTCQISHALILWVIKVGPNVGPNPAVSDARALGNKAGVPS
jgi:hypothetical protein